MYYFCKIPERLRECVGGPKKGCASVRVNATWTVKGYHVVEDWDYIASYTRQTMWYHTVAKVTGATAGLSGAVGRGAAELGKNAASVVLYRAAVVLGTATFFIEMWALKHPEQRTANYAHGHREYDEFEWSDLTYTYKRWSAVSCDEKPEGAGECFFLEGESDPRVMLPAPGSSGQGKAPNFHAKGH